MSLLLPVMIPTLQYRVPLGSGDVSNGGTRSRNAAAAGRADNDGAGPSKRVKTEVGRLGAWS